jgi:hypothetical protein
MRTRRTLLLAMAVIALVAISPVFAQDAWSGTAIVGRYGEFPPGGLYAASNTFPVNSMVDVTDDATGRSVRVIVVKRVEDPGVFLLLSEDAADALRMSSEGRASVTTRPVRMPGLTAINPSFDMPFHPDPDVNPAASAGDPNIGILISPEEEPEPEPEPEIALEAEPRVDPTPDPDEPPAAEAPRVAPAPAPAVTGPDLIVRSPDMRIPIAEDPRLEMPLYRAEPRAREPLVVTLALPTDPNDDTPRLVRPVPEEPEEDPLTARIAEIDRTLSAERISMIPPEVPSVPAERPRRNGLVPPPPRLTAVPELVLPLARVEDDAEVTDAPPRAPQPRVRETRLPLVAVAPEILEPDIEPVRPTHIPPEDAVLELEPAEFRSPDVPETPSDEDLEPDPAIAQIERAPERVPAPVPEPAVADDVDLPLVTRLERGYYVQAAALSNPEGAARAVRALNGDGAGYPVAVVSQQNGDRRLYRIFVGPLSADERGTALYAVRNQGFRDAFLRAE